MSVVQESIKTEETEGTKKKSLISLERLTIYLYVIGMSAIIFGFCELYCYMEPCRLVPEGLNVHVVDSTANYMINAYRAIALFVLSGVCGIVATLLKIYQEMKVMNQKNN